MELGGPARLRTPPDVKRWMLWASLILGALVLGWMAWRLARELGTAPAPRDRDTPPE
jgi:threonine/homoserine/homoserine lactone efflux protein